MAKQNGKQAEQNVFDLRAATRYLQDHSVDVGELRVRTLAREHAIFVNDPDTGKTKAGDSEVEKWQISRNALDQYIEAVKQGTARSTSSGAKAYKITLTDTQLVELRAWAKERGIADPERAHKPYAKKSAPTSDTPSVSELMEQGDSDEPIGTDANFDQSQA